MKKIDEYYRFMGSRSNRNFIAAEFHTHSKMHRGLDEAFNEQFIRAKEPAIF